MTCRIGILLAAGQGRRMGRFKQLLPWRTSQGDKPLVAASFDAVSDACDQMVVVVGHRAEEVVRVLAPRCFIQVKSDTERPMFESVRAGLSETARIDDQAAALIQPADHPEVSANTLRELFELADENPQQVVLPEFDGQGGHPVLIPAEVVHQLVDWPGDGGLRQFWRDNPQLCLRLTVNDPGVVHDLDTPRDFS